MKEKIIEYTNLSDIDFSKNSTLYKDISSMDKKVRAFDARSNEINDKISKEIFRDALVSGGNNSILDSLHGIENLCRSNGIQTKVTVTNDGISLVAYDENNQVVPVISYMAGSDGLVIRDNLVVLDSLYYSQNNATGKSQLINGTVAYLNEFNKILKTNWSKLKSQKQDFSSILQFARNEANKQIPITNQGTYKFVGNSGKEILSNLKKQKNVFKNKSKSFDVDPSAFWENIIYDTVRKSVAPGVTSQDQSWAQKEREIRPIIEKLAKEASKLPSVKQATRLFSEDYDIRKLITKDSNLKAKIMEAVRFFSEITWNQSNMSEADAHKGKVAIFGDSRTGISGQESITKKDQGSSYLKRTKAGQHNTYAHVAGGILTSKTGFKGNSADYDLFTIAPVESEAISEGMNNMFKAAVEHEKVARENIKKYGENIKHKAELIKILKNKLDTIKKDDYSDLEHEMISQIMEIYENYRTVHDTGNNQVQFDTPEEFRDYLVNEANKRFAQKVKQRKTYNKERKKSLTSEIADIKVANTDAKYKQAAAKAYHKINEESVEDFALDKLRKQYHMDFNPNKPHSDVLDDQIIIVKEALAEIQTQLMQQQVFTEKDIKKAMKAGNYQISEEAVLAKINEQRKQQGLDPVSMKDLKVGLNKEKGVFTAQYTEDFIIKEGTKLLNYLGRERWSSSSLPADVMKSVLKAQARLIASVKSGTNDVNDTKYQKEFAKANSMYFDSNDNLKVAGVSGISSSIKGEKFYGWSQGVMSYALGELFNQSYKKNISNGQEKAVAKSEAINKVREKWNESVDKLVAQGQLTTEQGEKFKQLVTGVNEKTGKVNFNTDSKITDFVNKNLVHYVKLINTVYKDNTGRKLGTYKNNKNEGEVFELDPYALYDIGINPSIVAEGDWDPHKRVSMAHNERQIKERENERLAAMGKDVTVERAMLDVQYEQAIEKNTKYQNKLKAVRDAVTNNFNADRIDVEDKDKDITAIVNLADLNNAKNVERDVIDPATFNSKDFTQTKEGIIWTAQQNKYQELLNEFIDPNKIKEIEELRKAKKYKKAKELEVLEQQRVQKAVLDKYKVESAKDIKIAGKTNIQGYLNKSVSGLDYDAMTGELLDLAGYDIEQDENGNYRINNTADYEYNRSILRSYENALKEDILEDRQAKFGTGIYKAGLERERAYVEKKGSEFEKFAKKERTHSKFLKTKDLNNAEKDTLYTSKSDINEMISQRENETDEEYNKLIKGIYKDTLGVNNAPRRKQNETLQDYNTRIKDSVLKAIIEDDKDLIMDVTRDPNNTAMAGMKVKIKHLTGIGEGVVGGDPALIKFLKGDYDGDRLGLALDADGNIIGAVRMTQKQVDEHMLKERILAEEDAEVLRFITNQKGGSTLPSASTAIKIDKNGKKYIENTTLDVADLTGLERNASTQLLSFEAKQNKDDYVGLYSNFRTSATTGLEEKFGKGLGKTVNTAKTGLAIEALSLLLARPEQAAISSKHLKNLAATDPELFKQWFEWEENENGELIHKKDENGNVIFKQAYLDRYEKLAKDLKNSDNWNSETQREALLQEMVNLGMIEGSGKFTDDQFFGEFWKLANTELGRKGLTGINKRYNKLYGKDGKLKAGADLSIMDLDFIRDMLNWLSVQSAELAPNETLGHIVTTGRQSALDKQRVYDQKNLIEKPTEKQIKEHKESLGKDVEVEILKSINLLIDTIRQSSGVIAQAAGISGGNGNRFAYNISNITDNNKRNVLAAASRAGGYTNKITPTEIARVNARSGDKIYSNWDEIIKILEDPTVDVKEKQRIIGQMSDADKNWALATRRGKLVHQFSEDQRLIEKYNLTNVDPNKWNETLINQFKNTNDINERKEISQFLGILNKKSDELNHENGGFVKQYKEFSELSKILDIKDTDWLSKIIASAQILNKMSSNETVIGKEVGMHNYINVNGEDTVEHGYIDQITRAAVKKAQTDINGEKYEVDANRYTMEDLKTTSGTGVDLSLKDAEQVLRYINYGSQANKQFKEELGGLAKVPTTAKELKDFLANEKDLNKYAAIRQFVDDIEENGGVLTDDQVQMLADKNAIFEGRIKKVDTQTNEAASYRIGASQAKELIQRSQNGEDISGFLGNFVEERQFYQAGNSVSELKEEITLLKQKYELQLKINKALLEGKDNEAAVLQEQEKEVDLKLKEAQKSTNKIADTTERKKYVRDTRKEIEEQLQKENDQALKLLQAQKNDKQKAGPNKNILARLSTGFDEGITQRLNRAFSGYAIFAKLTQGIQTVKKNVIDLDKVLTNLRIVTQQNEESTRNLIKGYSELAGELGVSTTAVATAGQEWLRQGYDIAETNKLIEASTKLSILGMMSSADAVKSLTSAMKGFKMESSEAIDIVDKLTKLDVNAATTAGEIASALSEFANAASLGGLNIDQASAMATTIMDVTQNSGSQAGNALKMMLSRFGNVKSGAYSTLNISGDADTESASLNDVEKVLKNIGVSLRSSNLEFRSFSEVLDEISEKWVNLDNVSKNAIATAFAGTRQRESFLVLMENYDKYQQLLKVSESAAGTSEEKIKSYQESIAALQEEIKAAWENLANNKSISDFLKLILSTTTQLIKWLPWIVNILKPLLATKTISIASNFFGNGLKNGFSGLFKNVTATQKNTTAIEKLTTTLENTSNTSGNGVYSRNNIAVGAAGITSTGALTYGNKSVGLGDDGKYYYLKNDGSLSKRSVSAAGQKEIQQTAENNKKLKKAGSWRNKTGGEKVAAGAAAGLLAGLTADTDTKDIYGTGDTTVNSTLQTIDKVATGAVTGIATAIGGPIVGGIANILMEVATKYAMPWLEKIFFKRDFELKLLNKSINEAKENIEKINNIQNSLNTLVELSNKNILIGEDYTKAVDEFNKISAALVDDPKTLSVWNEILHNTDDLLDGVDNETLSLSTLREAYLTGSAQERAEIATALRASSELVEAREFQRTYSAKMYEVNETINSARQYDAEFLEKNGVLDQYKQYAKNKYAQMSDAEIIKQFGSVASELKYGINWLGGWTNFNTNKMTSLDVVAQEVRKYLEDNVDKTFQDNFNSDVHLREELSTLLNESVLVDYWNQTIESLTKQLEQGENVSEELRKANNELNKVQNAINLKQNYTDEINYKYAQAALSASGLENLTQAQLNNMGYKDKLNKIAENMESYGYSVYNSDGVLSAQAQTYIENAIRSNSKIYGSVSGQVYSLAEVLNKDNENLFRNYQEILWQWSEALGVSVDELDDLKDTLGDITLAQVLKTPDETRQNISELTSMFTSISSSTGITAENIENIITKFPQLLPYASSVGDLIGGLTKGIEQYSKLYAYQITNQILNSESVLSDIQKNMREGTVDVDISEDDQKQLYETLLSNYSFGNGSVLNDMLGLIWGNAEENGISEENQEKLRTIVESYLPDIENTLERDSIKQQIDYQQKLFDQQINNLQEQKEMLDNINHQREYENKLIEAKLKLENSQKEKKRVWRSGVGWTYEADQNSILEAQKQLEDVENEKNVSKIDQEIQLLNSQKELLANIASSEEFENMRDSWKGWSEQMKLYNEDQETIITNLSTLYSSISKISTKDIAEDIADAGVNNADEKLNTLDTLYNTAQSYITGENKNAPTTVTASQEYADWENNRNNALTAYQTKANEYKNVITQDWQTKHSDHAAIMKASQLHNQQDTIMIDGKAYTVGNQPLSDTDPYYQWVQDDLRAGEKGPQDSNGKGKGKYVKVFDPKTSTETNEDGILNYSRSKSKTYGEVNGSDDKKDYSSLVLSDVAASLSDGTILSSESGTVEYVMVMNHQLRQLDPKAKGTLDLNSHGVLLNELGTEAIVTPQGTITALPSHSGIVPADITRNLWELGEISPTLTHLLDHLNNQMVPGKSVFGNDESFNINTINMTVNADNSFDAQKFIESVRQRAALTKHNR